MYYNIKPRLYTISTCIVVINIIYFLVLELSGASSSVEGMLSFGAARADLIFFDHQYFRLLSAYTFLARRKAGTFDRQIKLYRTLSVKWYIFICIQLYIRYIC